jgi:hypothetical protein
MRVFRAAVAAALLQNFSFESAGLLKRLVNFSNSGDGTAVIRMQIHRQTQIIITDRPRSPDGGEGLLLYGNVGVACGGLFATGRPQMSRRVTEYGRVTCLQIAPN